MKKKLISLALAATLCMPFALAACGGNTDSGNNNAVTPEDAEGWYTDYETVNNSNYNQDLYYLNELSFMCADPSVIYVDRGEEKGYFYAYGTSDLIDNYGILCWRSKDLTNWEYKSIAYNPDFDNCWATRNHWAPEVIYDAEQGGYLMFYNADWAAMDKMTDPNKWYEVGSEAKNISVVFSKNPYGPFEPITKQYATLPVYDFSTRNSAISKSLQRDNVIDAHPYIDPNTGDKYMYYSGYGYDGLGIKRGQTIFGVKMKNKNWLEPDYGTVKELTKLFNSTTDRNDDDIDEGKGVAAVNEGAFVWYEDGKYYLTFSVYAFDQPMYQVRQAISDSPLGDFTKIQPADGGQILYTEGVWDGKISSSGHHAFIVCGDQLMISYHTFINRRNNDDKRAIALDTISWVTNSKGQKLMHANGPTYSYQPLPEEISGYKNLAPLATVTADNVKDGYGVEYLTDGVLKMHSNDMATEYSTSGGKTNITLKFDKYVNARSIMVYNSSSYDNTFVNIDSITLHARGKGNTDVVRTIEDIPFDYNWHTDLSSVVYPGASSIVEFDEMPVNEITVTVDAAPGDEIRINEIVVLGKTTAVGTAESARDAYSYAMHDPVQPDPVFESRTFGSVNGYYSSNYGYDLSHDDGTENAYVEKTWCGNLQQLYFKDVESTVLYAEVEMSVLDHTTPYNGDPAPKAGLVLKSRSNYFVSYNIDYTKTFNNPVVGFVQSNSSGKDYNWNNYRTKEVHGLSYTGDNYAKLAIARVDSTVYLFANDTLVDVYEGLGILTDDERSATAVSLVTFNCFTRFKNYSVITDRSAVLEKIAQLRA